MGLIKFALGVVAGVFIASHSPESAEMIREYSKEVFAAIASMVS